MDILSSKMLVIIMVGVALLAGEICPSLCEPFEDTCCGGSESEQTLLSTLLTAAGHQAEATKSSTDDRVGTAAEIFFDGGSVKDKLKTGVEVAIDEVLSAVTGSESGAALVKTAVGVVGEALGAASSSLGESSVGNNKMMSVLLGKTSSFGTLLSEYGAGSETVSLLRSILSGELTLLSVLQQARIAMVDYSLSTVEERMSIVGKVLQVVGVVVEFVGDFMSNSANSPAEVVLDEITTKLGADVLLKCAFSEINKMLDVSLEGIIIEKLAQIDRSTASTKEIVMLVGVIIEITGSTLVSLGDSLDDLAGGSVTDYSSILISSLSNLS